MTPAGFFISPDPEPRQQGQRGEKQETQETIMPAGRPSSFKPEFVEQARALCWHGATDAEMAEFFGVQVSTLNLWKSKHPEFSESLKENKTTADDRVERSLYQRAIGYTCDEVDIRVVEGQIVQTPILKHYPPDTTAAIFWLKNRRKDEWRDKTEVEQNHNFSDEMREWLDQR